MADVQEGIQRVVQRMLQDGASVRDEQISLGDVAVVDVDNNRAGSGDLTVVSGSSRVLLSRSWLQSLPAGSAVSLADLKPRNKDPLQVPGVELATPTMDLSVWDRNGRHMPMNLSEPIFFKLPDALGRAKECAFLEVLAGGGARWSTRGVRRATVAEVLARGGDPAGVWCASEHLSIFAALLDAILGCTNMELLTPAALRAVAENEGWHNASAPVLTFFIVMGFLFFIVAGTFWELWSFRLGRTFAPAKELLLCRNLKALGPKLLKYKYMAFILYVKDTIMCMKSGRGKLRKSTLLASLQRFLAVRTHISVGVVTAHCWNGGAWNDPKASVANTVLCRKLEFHAGRAEKELYSDLDSFMPWHMFQRYLMTFLAVHPVIDATRLGANSLTVMKRATMQLAAVFGVLATNSLIFNFSGSMRSWESDAECPINPRSQLFILVASTMSVLVSVLPNAFLTDIAKQIHGRPLGNAIFWALLTLYMGLTGLILVSALANMNPKDSSKWYRGLQFSMTIKLVVMPAAMALRHSLVLEFFLWEDRRTKPSQQFATVLGLRHPGEVPLSAEAKETMEKMAGQAVSAQELVKFTALLGDKAMRDFDPEKSTSEEVFAKAIQPLCSKPPTLEERPMTVEVSSAFGLAREGSFRCGLLHLGRQVKDRRPILHEERSAALRAAEGACPFALERKLPELEPGQALAFVVEQTGVAWLTAEQALKGWQGELPLQPLQSGLGPDGKGGFLLPGQAAPVRVAEVNGSSGRAEAVGSSASVVVRVTVPDDHVKARRLHKLRKQMSDVPTDRSEVPEFDDEFNADLTESISQEVPAASNALLCGNFPTSPCVSRPPDRMVVHSRKARFLELVASVLADALNRKDAYTSVQTMLRDRDFKGLLAWLEEAGCNDIRYWIEMFAMDPAVSNRQSPWHEDFLAGLPTILRKLRHSTCYSMIEDILAKRKPRASMVKQVLVLDRSYHFLQEKTCLAEMMLAKAMQVRQHLILHPEQLHDSGLGGALKGMAEALGSNKTFHEDLPWTTPYLEDRQKLYDTVLELTKARVKEEREDSESVWKELDMTDVGITIGAVRVSQRRDRRGLDELDPVNDGGGGEDGGDQDGGDGGGGADADV